MSGSDSSAGSRISHTMTSWRTHSSRRPPAQSRGPRRSLTITTSARSRACWRVRDIASTSASAHRGLRQLVVRGDRLHLQQDADEADAALARRHEERIGMAVRQQAEAVAAAAGDVPDREHDALGDVGLAAQRRAEAHRRRAVEHEPRRQRPLRDVQAHVRLVHARGRVPVDQAHVVARLVGPHLRELHRDAERRRAVLAREQALDPAAHRQIEGAQRHLRHGPGAGPCRSGRHQCEGYLAHATSFTSSTRGIGTRSSTGPDDGLGADALGEGAVREHEAVAHRVRAPARARRRGGRSGGRAARRARARRAAC